MLDEDKTQERIDRHKITQEDFTPIQIVELLCQGSEELFTDFSKTFCDPCCGIGNIVIYILRKRFENCHNQNDIINALDTCYGTELMEDNVEECKTKIYSLIEEFNFEITDKIKEIVNHNIVCTDTFKWNYDDWKPIEEKKCEGLF